MALILTAPTRMALVAGVISALCGSVLVASPATAAPASESSTSTLSSETFVTLQSAIDVKTGTFDGAEAAAAGVPAPIVDDFATGWAAGGNPVTGASVNVDELAAVRAATPEIRACSGRNRWDYTGIQLNVYINSCNSDTLIGLLTTGTGIATIAAALTAITGLGVVAAGAVAGVLGAVTGVLTTCAARGRGIVIHNIPPGPVVWCNGQ